MKIIRDTIVLKYLFQYSTTLLLGGLLFGNFIACGAKMYQVSLDGDLQNRRTLGNELTPNGDNQALSASEQVYPGIHAPGGWVEVPIKYKFSEQLNESQRQGLASAMKTWEQAVGKKLFDFVGYDQKSGDDFKDLFSSLNDRVNGYYEDYDWDKTNKSNVVLATTIWENPVDDIYSIANADIRFNSQHFIIGDSFILEAEPSKEVVDMETLALHELGHLLGLGHIPEEIDQYSIMNPSIFIGEGLANRKISRLDIDRIQRIYGCEGQSCDADAIFEMLETAQTGDENADFEAH